MYTCNYFYGKQTTLMNHVYVVVYIAYVWCDPNVSLHIVVDSLPACTGYAHVESLFNLIYLSHYRLISGAHHYVRVVRWDGHSRKTGISPSTQWGSYVWFIILSFKKNAAQGMTWDGMLLWIVLWKRGCRAFGSIYPGRTNSWCKFWCVP